MKKVFVLSPGESVEITGNLTEKGTIQTKNLVGALVRHINGDEGKTLFVSSTKNSAVNSAQIFSEMGEIKWDFIRTLKIPNGCKTQSAKAAEEILEKAKSTGCENVVILTEDSFDLIPQKIAQRLNKKVINPIQPTGPGSMIFFDCEKNEITQYFQ